MDTYLENSSTTVISNRERFSKEILSGIPKKKDDHAGDFGGELSLEAVSTAGV